MRIRRVFQDTTLSTGARIELDANASNHIARVLRLRPGAPLVLFDGRGGEFEAVVIEGGRAVLVECGKALEHRPESSLKVTLCQGISRGERMDFALQKAVELGVARIQPLFTERTVVNLSGERLEKRVQHWRGVVIGACEQSGRTHLPELLPAVRLAEWLAQPTQGLGLVLDHRAERGLSAITRPADGAVSLLIGPEGGLAAEELSAARKAGFTGIRMGPRILRTETAALTALALLQSRWGDLD